MCLTDGHATGHSFIFLRTAKPVREPKAGRFDSREFHQEWEGNRAVHQVGGVYPKTNPKSNGGGKLPRMIFLYMGYQS